jgi:hypothetical protein
MVLNRKQRKQHRGTKRFAEGCGARKQYSKRSGAGVQHGGVSPACVYDGATGTDVLVRNGGANIHNTNPQASLDLDNKFMSYGGAVPLGSNILQGGAANCGDEGKGGAGNGKSETFKQYLDGLSSNYMVGGQPNHSLQEPLKNEQTSMIPITEPNLSKLVPNKLTKVGGGFSTDTSKYIAGLPVYKPYDDCCPPAIVNNQLVQGAPDQPVCGLGAIKGGARRQQRKRASSRKHKHKRSSIKKNRNSKRRSNTRRQGGGGDFVYSATKSTPAPMTDAFNGPDGVFRYPDDMMTRTFDEVQPNYSVNAI